MIGYIDEIRTNVTVNRGRYAMKTLFLSNTARRVKVIFWNDRIDQFDHLVQLGVVIHLDNVLARRERATNNINLVDMTLHIQHSSIVETLGYFPIANIDPIPEIVPDHRIVEANFENIVSLHQGCFIGKLVFSL